MNIVVTGGDGFLATHARFFFHEKIKAGAVLLTTLSRNDFNNDNILLDSLRHAELILHFAGINNGTANDLEQGNVALAERLAHFHTKSESRAHIVYSSSTHEDRDTAYGRGKKEAGELLLRNADITHSRTTVCVLPNVFGEFAKPRYNSVVATFCDDLAFERASEINSEGTIELLYVQEAIAHMVDAYESGVAGRVRLQGSAWSIPNLYALLSKFNSVYRTGEFPDTGSMIELHLFNTLHAFLFDVLFPYTLTPRLDDRGTLFEVARSGRKDQIFYSSTKPGKIRGEHYHTRKMERFCVVSGEGEIAVRRLHTSHTRTFKVSGANPVAIDMPTFCTHNLRNIGDSDLATIFWISEQFNPEASDTFNEKV